MLSLSSFPTVTKNNTMTLNKARITHATPREAGTWSLARTNKLNITIDFIKVKCYKFNRQNCNAKREGTSTRATKGSDDGCSRRAGVTAEASARCRRQRKDRSGHVRSKRALPGVWRANGNHPPGMWHVPQRPGGTVYRQRLWPQRWRGRKLFWPPRTPQPRPA